METYWEVLEKIKEYFTIVRLCDYHSGNYDKSKKVCLMRHDVDIHINNAMKMAKFEQERNIKTTYYMLHTQEYYSEEDFIDKCLEIQEMGHEVGLHNDVLTQCIQTGENPSEVFDKEIKHLRDNKIDVRGVVGHGTWTCRKNRCKNFLIFKGKQFFRYNVDKVDFIEVKRKKKIIYKVPLHTIDLAKYNLYDAYFLQRVYANDDIAHVYASNCGGTWGIGSSARKYYNEEIWKKNNGEKHILDFIDVVGKDKGVKVLSVLIHPRPWMNRLGDDVANSR